MNKIEFKRNVRAWCASKELPRPPLDTITYLRKEYHAFLATAPVVDCYETLDQFLFSEYLNKKEEMITTNNTVSLGCCVATPTVSWSNPICWVDDCCAKSASLVKSKVCPKQEVENTMSYEKSDISVQRDYFRNRVNDIYYVHFEEINKQFRMNKSETPVNYKQLIDAIEKKQYKLNDKRIASITEDDGSITGYGAFDGIIWQLPDAPDWDGYRAAEKEMLKAKQTARDVIAAATTGDAMLKAVTDFEAWTPTGKAN